MDATTALAFAVVLSLGLVTAGFVLGRDYWRRKAIEICLTDLFNSNLADPIKVRQHYETLAKRLLKVD
jgi:hypothetical protein